MASPTNSVTTLNSKGIREDLEDTISRVAPEEVPFTGSLKSVSAKQHYHEWQNEGIDTPQPIPVKYQGEDATPEAGNFSTRLGTYCQHFERSFIVASVLNEVDLAGRTNEMNRQTVLKGLALKRDIEKRMLGNYASAPEVAGTTPYATQGALACVKTNANRGTGGVSGGFSNGTYAAATPGANRAFTEAQLKSSMNQLYSQSGSMKDRVAFMSPTQKQVAAAFTGLVQNRREAGEQKAVIIGGSDVYVSDFGRITFQPSIFCDQNNVLVVDPSLWGIANLRSVSTVDLAKNGDADKRMIIADKGLICYNELGAAVIADVA